MLFQPAAGNHGDSWLKLICSLKKTQWSVTFPPLKPLTVVREWHLCALWASGIDLISPFELQRFHLTQAGLWKHFHSDSADIIKGHIQRLHFESVGSTPIPSKFYIITRVWNEFSEGPSVSRTHSFIQKIFIEQLLCPKQLVRPRGLSKKEGRHSGCPPGARIHVEEAWIKLVRPATLVPGGDGNMGVQRTL